MELRDAPRELIRKYVSMLEEKLELTPVHAALKEMFPTLQEIFRQGGKCSECKAPSEGHFFEECVARRVGSLAHLYRTKARIGGRMSEEIEQVVWRCNVPKCGATTNYQGGRVASAPMDHPGVLKGWIAATGYHMVDGKVIGTRFHVCLKHGGKLLQRVGLYN